MHQTRVVKKIKTYFVLKNVFPKIVQFMRRCGKICYSLTGHRWQYETVHATYTKGKEGYIHTLTLTLTLTMCNNYSFRSNNGCTNGPQCHIHTYIVILLYNYEIKVKVKWSRYRPGVAQRVGRGIALLFHDRGTRRGWVVSSTPRPQFTAMKETRYPFYRRLGGPQDRSGR